MGTKVRLTVHLDLPDEYDNLTEPELQQLIFDEYVNHAACAHFEQSTHWLTKPKHDKSARLIADSHREWGMICRKAKMEVEIV